MILSAMPVVQPVEDWVMLYFIATVLLSCLLLGPFLHQFLDFLAYTFNRKTFAAEIRTLNLPPFLSVCLSTVSLASASLTVVLAGFEVPGRDNGRFLAAAAAFSAFALAFILKQTLARTVNKKLYAMQRVAVKPVRWNNFSSTMLAFLGLLLTILNAVSIFATLPGGITLKIAVIVSLIPGIALVVKVKTALFSTQCNFLGILLYLCALEFGPVVFALVILGTNTVIH